MNKEIKIVLNVDYGGFGLSKKAIIRMRELGSDWAKRVLFKGKEHPWQNYIEKSSDNSYALAAKKGGWWDYVDRTDPILIQVVEELGPEANGSCAELAVKTVNFSIEAENKHDGIEEVVVNTYVEDWR